MVMYANNVRGVPTSPQTLEQLRQGMAASAAAAPMVAAPAPSRPMAYPSRAEASAPAAPAAAPTGAGLLGAAPGAAAVPGGLLGALQGNSTALLMAGLGGLSGTDRASQWGNMLQGLQAGMSNDAARKREAKEDAEKKRNEDREKAFAESISGFLKSPEMAAAIKADPRRATDMLRLHLEERRADQAQRNADRGYDLDRERFTYSRDSAEKDAAFKRELAGRPDVKIANDGTFYTTDPATGKTTVDTTNRRLTPSTPPSGYRFSRDGTSLEAIPGGPATKDQAIPGDLAGRKGMMNVFLKQAPDILEKIESGTVTGPLDQLWGRGLGWGEAGETYRQIQSGVDALRRGLTGAGMPAAEADEYASRYLPQATDTADTAKSKFKQLQAEVQSISDTIDQGRQPVLPNNWRQTPMAGPGSDVPGARLSGKTSTGLDWSVR